MKAQGPPRPAPKPPERSSLQTEVRGISEKVKLLEDILGAYMKAHGDLIKYLEAPRNRSQLLSAVKNGKGKEILKSAFREVDRASARHRAMLRRMNEINDAEEAAHVHSTEEMFDTRPFSACPLPEGWTAEHQDELKRVFDHGPDAAKRHAEAVKKAAGGGGRTIQDCTDKSDNQREFKIPKDGTVLVGVEDKRPEALNPLVEEFVEGLEATKKHITATVQDILELKKAEIGGVAAYDAAQEARKAVDSGKKAVTATEKSRIFVENDSISAENEADGT